MSFYPPQVQIGWWKTTTPSVNHSQTCLGFFLIHGICWATSFLILWFKKYCYGSLNTEHMAPQNKPLVHTLRMKTSAREEAGQTRRWAAWEWCQEERMLYELQLRRQRALGCWGLAGKGPPRNWRSWKRVQSRPGVAVRWQCSWWDPDAACAVLARRLINRQFFICFWELTSFEWVGIHWSTEMARR